MNNLKNKYITEFPYQRKFISDKEIKEMFQKLKKYDYKERLISKSYTIKNINLPSNQLTFLGKPLLLISNKDDYYNWRRLSDMFQEECRMKCKLFGQEQSPEEYFYSNIKKVNEYALNKYKKITPRTVREAVYDMTRECTSHNPAHIVAMIQMFKTNTILDFSSGWGDRLIGAMSRDVDYYCGIDPNPCLHPNYESMIKFFDKSSKKYVMIENTIEDAKIPNKKFNMIFTSPPYFDLEIYRKNKVQSSKYDNEREWFNNFLKVAIKKVWRYLEDGGIMCLNINQKSKGENYIRWMLEEVNSYDNSNYLGVISYANEDIRNPQPIWIWKKHTFRIETERLYIRKFKFSDIKQMSDIMGKKDNMKYIASGKTKNYNETKNMIERYIYGTYTFYPILLKRNNRIIGYLGYFDGVYLDKKYKSMNFTRILIDNKYRGKGYGKEIYKKFLEYVNKKVYAMILPNNVASVKLHRSVGFEFDKRIEFHGKIYELYVWKSN